MRVQFESSAATASADDAQPSTDRAKRPAKASCIAALAGFVALCFTSLATPAEQKEIFGYLEEVELVGAEYTLAAKLDTGADNSSLDATRIKRFRRSGISYVRFTVEGPQKGDEVTIEKRLVRMATIKRHDGNHQRRPIVNVTVCFGPFLREIEVSLIDRSHFDYPVLLGRSALDGVAVVDPELSFTQPANCDESG